MVPPGLLVSCKFDSSRSVWVDILFLFFNFRVAKRVGSSVTNETSFVGYQIFNFFSYGPEEEEDQFLDRQECWVVVIDDGWYYPACR